MPSLGTPHAASKAAPHEPVAKGVFGYARANYNASDTQAVTLDRNAGTTTNQPTINHAAFTSEVKLGNDSLNAKGKRIFANTVSKTSTALSDLNGKNNVNVQQNVTLSDARDFGFVSMMQNDITVDKIPKDVLKLLKKLVPALRKKPEDVTLLSGGVSSAVGTFNLLKGASSYGAYDATNGEVGQVWMT